MSHGSKLLRLLVGNVKLCALVPYYWGKFLPSLRLSVGLLFQCMCVAKCYLTVDEYRRYAP